MSEDYKDYENFVIDDEYDERYVCPWDGVYYKDY